MYEYICVKLDMTTLYKIMVDCVDGVCDRAYKITLFYFLKNKPKIFNKMTNAQYKTFNFLKHLTCYR